MTVHHLSTPLSNQSKNHVFKSDAVNTRHNSWIVSALSRIAEYFEARRQRRIDRLAFQHMLTLDDDMLKDIGVTRDDVIWASQLPLDINASRTLETARKNGRD